METFFNSNSKSKEMYFLEEDEFTDDYYFSDWSEFVKNIRKSRLDREMQLALNVNLIKFNLKLINNLNILIKKFENFVINLKISNLNLNNFFGKNYQKLFDSLDLYRKIDYNNIKKMRNKDYYSNSNNIIVIIDIRPSKPKIFIIHKDKCLLTLTPGIIYKKLSMKQKKIKKTEKMLNLMLKTTFLKIQRNTFIKKCIIHLKGTRSNLFNVLVLINNNFKSKKLFLIYSPHIGFNKFKFKKLKSIKRRLRKRFSKLIKN